MNQEGEVISCADPEFSNGAWLSYNDIALLEAEIEKFRDKYDGLIGFVKGAVRSSIDKRKGKDVDDLKLILQVLD